jgi:AcrR family transcriptional regulator
MATNRKYVAPKRELSAQATRKRILKVARRLFSRSGVDAVSIDAIASGASVSASTVYTLFKSKAGILRDLLHLAIFSEGYKQASSRLEGVREPTQVVAVTAAIARTIYENEAREIGLLRGVAMFSPELKKIENEFETARLRLQEARIDLLFELKAIRRGIQKDRARHLMWMYTSRDVYRMLVSESGWSADEYQAWLAEQLQLALLRPKA